MGYLVSMSVLIADNDHQVSGLLSEVLKQIGVTPSHAYDGDEARRMAQEPGLDVLVCDLDMPGASGLEVLESLRALDRPPLVVVVSGYLDARIEAQLRTMSYVQEVLRKPFDLLGFAGIVRRLLGVARAARGVGETEDEAAGC
jgi:DNA-binding response OmpR family regulator